MDSLSSAPLCVIPGGQSVEFRAKQKCPLVRNSTSDCGSGEVGGQALSHTLRDRGLGAGSRPGCPSSSTRTWRRVPSTSSSVSRRTRWPAAPRPAGDGVGAAPDPLSGPPQPGQRRGLPLRGDAPPSRGALAAAQPVRGVLAAGCADVGRLASGAGGDERRHARRTRRARPGRDCGLGCRARLRGGRRPAVGPLQGRPGESGR